MIKNIIKVDSALDIWQLLRPRKCNDLTRIGGYKDGGYCVPSEYLQNLALFINFGVGEDFDFEIELRKKYRVLKILSFDHLVCTKYFVIHLIKGLLKFSIFRCSIDIVLKRLGLLAKFIFFYKFSKNVKFFKVKVDSINIESILTDLPLNSAIKVDIEGGEYALLDAISANKDKFNFIIMEFHDVQFNEKNISNFVKVLSGHFIIAHLSINNRTSDIHYLPDTIELTLCRGVEKYTQFIDLLPNAQLDWNFPDKPIFQLNYSEN